jgi:cob(I)alamin adenosyltransferase
MTEPTDPAEAERHRAKMAKRKAVQDAEVAGKTVEKGLLIVHTGTGKGKSTAAFGHRARDIAAAERAWAKASELMDDPSFRLIVLDELSIALRYDYLDLQSVIARLGARRGDLHVVVTGRNAKPELIAAADLVTEMTLVKHHFAAGVKAQPGIEF